MEKELTYWDWLNLPLTERTLTLWNKIFRKLKLEYDAIKDYDEKLKFWDKHFWDKEGFLHFVGNFFIGESESEITKPENRLTIFPNNKTDEIKFNTWLLNHVQNDDATQHCNFEKLKNKFYITISENPLPYEFTKSEINAIEKEIEKNKVVMDKKFSVDHWSYYAGFLSIIRKNDLINESSETFPKRVLGYAKGIADAYYFGFLKQQLNKDQESFDELKNSLSKKKDTSFFLKTMSDGTAETSGEFLSFKSAIEQNGYIDLKSDKDTFKIYSPFIIYIFHFKDLPVTNLDTKTDISLNGFEYIKTYKEGFRKGEKYFESEFAVSTSILYGDKGEEYIRDLHNNFFHLDSRGWHFVKRNMIDIILTHSLIEEYGYYAGLVSKVEEMVKKYPKLFENFSKCEHDILPPQVEIPNQPKLESSRTKQFISDAFERLDKTNGWKYAFTNETDYIIFLNLLIDYFEYKKPLLPSKIIKLKRDCKTRFAQTLKPIHKELSENQLKSDIEFFNLMRVLNHFEKDTDIEIYNALKR